MSAENRLTAEQLAALAPGDTVTIESGLEFNRRRYTTGTVARLTARHAVVRVGSYVERYRLQDGVRDGGNRAELVHGEPQADSWRGAQHIDALYRQWSRHRGDVEALRQLHAAIGEVLDEATASVR